MRLILEKRFGKLNLDTEKIERNKKRDKEVNRHYKKIGWKIIRVWEHEINKDIKTTLIKTKKIY